MIIYAFDERFAPEFRRASSRESVTDFEIVTILQTDSLHDAVEKIRNRAGTERNIWLLRIVAHGCPGGMLFGQEYVNTANVTRFQALAPYFTPTGRGIELHSCNVASAETTLTHEVAIGSGGTATWTSARGTPGGSGGIGGAFLLALAQATGVNVMAGYDTQFIDSGFRWEGRGTMTMEPTGTSITQVGADVRPVP